MAAIEDTLKRLAAPIVRAVGLPLGTVAMWALRFTARRAGVALVYHGMAPQSGDPRREFVAPHGAALFEAELRHLARRYRVVKASELPRAVAERRRGERFPVAVTLDDDLRSHVEHALPALRRTGVTATFFLTGATLAGPVSFWWERLQRVIDADRSRLQALLVEAGATTTPNDRPVSIQELARHIETLDPEARDAFAASLPAGDPSDDGLRADGVRTLVQAGMTVGFHTRRHHPLPTLDDRALAAAFTEGRSELEEIVGGTLTIMGYPHGRADERVAAAARRAGFEVGYTGSGRAVRAGDDALLLGRIDPSYRSVGHFALQIPWALSRG
jgi:peptidoglycan/xylan/chitin deacetylase (PgdA/CDA1 family)